MPVFLALLTLIFFVTAGCQEGNEASNQHSSSSANSAAVSSTQPDASSSSAASSAETAASGCELPQVLTAAETRPMLVVRVNYSDTFFQNNAAVWHEKIFGTGMHDLNHYYKINSRDLFAFSAAQESDGAADGIITVTLSKAHPDYDINSQLNTLTMLYPDLHDALVNTDAAIDYAMYDTDANGAITPDELVIIFIVAGNEDAFSGNNNLAGVWAHASCVDQSNAPTLDGVSLMGCTKSGKYAVFGERHIDTCYSKDPNGQCIGYNEDASIGIIAHELGHAAFDLPDLYDTSGQSAGIGYFGLMGSGLWGKADADDAYGGTPVSFMAWSQAQNGWVVPEPYSATSDKGLTLYDTAHAAYNIAYLPMGGSECILIENRSPDGYDAGLNIINGAYQGGMAIWHIDQSVINAKQLFNQVQTDADHKGIDLEEANNAGLDSANTFAGDARNLFYQDNSPAFSATTEPSSHRYDGSDSGIAVTQISTRGPVMTAVVTNPNEEAQ